MLVRVEMKNGDLYKGIKCGTEGGLLYLVNPVLLTQDESEEMDGYWESDVGEEIEWNAANRIRVIQLPLVDINKITSAQR